MDYKKAAQAIYDKAGKKENLVSAAHCATRLRLVLTGNAKTVFYGHDTGVNMSPEAWALVTAERYDLISLDATMGKRPSPTTTWACRTMRPYSKSSPGWAARTAAQ